MTHDYILVGGGLQNGLNALAILEGRPDARIALVERGSRLGGNHTWCFHADDVPDSAGAIVGPLIEHRWLGYQVRFPRLERTLASPYAGISSARFHQVVADRMAAAPSAELLLDCDAVAVGAHTVELADGRPLTGRAVIDARGPGSGDDCGGTGFQCFFGMELELARPHGLGLPILMDATVDQRNGFRFFYLLPLADDRILIEETFFIDRPLLDIEASRSAIRAYADQLGLEIEAVVRSERGVLPLPWEAPLPAPVSSPLVAGYRGGWFHPVTGYSFPAAVKLAVTVGRTDPDELFGAELAALASHQRSQSRFAFRLNRMLFSWFVPEQRYNVLERFYRLPEPVIRRFYALELTAGDRVRILVGRPPRGMSWRAALHLGDAR